MHLARPYLSLQTSYTYSFSGQILTKNKKERRMIQKGRKAFLLGQSNFKVGHMKEKRPLFRRKSKNHKRSRVKRREEKQEGGSFNWITSSETKST